MDEKLRSLIRSIVNEEKLQYAVLSSPREKTAPQKISIRPFNENNHIVYQFSYYYPQKVLHENYDSPKVQEVILQNLQNYKQALFCSSVHDYQILINKKSEATILKKPPTKSSLKMASHNRQKNYCLQEGDKIPFLIELGVQSASGKIIAQKYDKFRQINRFLEMVQDILPNLPKDRPIRMIDFGCGKAYLTFALYHYLHIVLGYDLQMVGLDLKTDVVAYCQTVANKLQFSKLQFEKGDINSYSTNDSVDLMVCLHACDTATDAALEKAIQWKTKVILAVPCCQHELYHQVSCESLQPLLKHGILKERFAALATDAARAQLLEMAGYKTQILEFIDLEHTPKNLLIRAVLQEKIQNVDDLKNHYKLYKNYLNILPDLDKRLSL